MATATLTWYAYLVDTWTDITSSVLAVYKVNVKWGMQTEKPNDRLARSDTMTMTLDNSAGLYDPGLSTCLTGWAKNTKVKLVITFDGTSYIRFRGSVEDIILNDPSVYESTVKVTVLGYMNKFYRYPAVEVTTQANVLGGSIVNTLISAQNEAPQSTLIDVGDIVYPAGFDTTTIDTKGSTEANKIVQSEGGYLYNRHDRTYGETIVFEDASHRRGDALSQFPKMLADCNELADESAVTLTDENGVVLVANEVYDAKITEDGASNSGKFKKPYRTHGDSIINKIRVTAHPKKIDASAVALFELDSPIKIPAGKTVTYTGTYSNTDGQACNAISDTMIAPVATTDYLMNSNSSGTGTNLVANLTVVATFYTAVVKFTLTNTSAYLGYVTKLQCRGYGVYQLDTI